MAKFAETVTSVNSLIRTALGLAVVGAFGFGGWLVYDNYIGPEIRARRAAQLELDETRAKLELVNNELSDAQQTVALQANEIADLEEANERLETAMRLLKVDHRLAHIKVLKVGEDPDTGVKYSDVEFVELTPDGNPMGKPKQYRLNGDDIRVDCWIVKFEDKYIQESDLHRSTSLCVFRSIYGNVDGPTNAFQLEEEYSRPDAYARGSLLTDFEKKIWDDFWDISNNPARALELGIRANHGQVNYVRAQEGVTYQVDLRASDGLTIRPIKFEDSSSADSTSG